MTARETVMSRISIKDRGQLPAELLPLWDKMTSYGDFADQAGVMAQRLRSDHGRVEENVVSSDY